MKTFFFFSPSFSLHYLWLLMIRNVLESKDGTIYIMAVLCVLSRRMQTNCALESKGGTGYDSWLFSVF